MKIHRPVTFRRQLSAAMLLCSLLPLMICMLLMVQITRLQLVGHAREDAAQQLSAVTEALNGMDSALRSAAEALDGRAEIKAALYSGDSGLLPVNRLLYEAAGDARGYAEFLLADSEGLCRYSTGGGAGETLPTDWGVLRAAAASGQPAYVSCENPADTSAPLLSGAVRLANGGYLVMRVYSAGFQVLTDGKYPQSELLIVDAFYHGVYASRSDLLTNAAPGIRTAVLAGETPAYDDYLLTFSERAAAGVTAVLCQPALFMNRTISLLYTVGLLCCIVCFILCVLFSLGFSRRISRPVRELGEGFRQVRGGNLKARVHTGYRGDLAELAAGFNEMVAALDEDRKALVHNRQELNNAQIRLLQAQLNPHFLCNTLDTMKWISKIHQVPQVALMSTDLADILRFCISADEFVPLYREMEIVERYVEIQRIRLSDDFAFSAEIPEELYDCVVPKMILQPLVENAVLHGLNGSAGNRIRIRAEATPERVLRITVSDNGSGFPETMLGKPPRQEQRSGRSHLGLYNVDTILRRHYGEAFGLTLGRGSDGIGAAVTAALPIRYSEEE